MDWIRNHKRASLIGLLIFVRLVVLLAFPSIFAFEQTGTIHGSEAYDTYAQNLLASGVYGVELGEPDASIPPFYSYVLAGWYSLLGRGGIQVGLLHILFDAISLWLLYDIARRLFPPNDDREQTRGEWIATLSGMFFVFYPYLIFQNLTLIDTPLFITQLHLFVWLVILLREREQFDRGTLVLAILAGLVLGITTLTRPILPIFAIFTAIWYLFHLNLRQTILRLFPVAVISVLVLFPWIARNYGVYDRFVPMTTTSGSNFWQGNSEWVIPVFQAGYDVQWTAPEEIDTEALDPVTADSMRFDLATQFLQENPQIIPELLWTKFLVHWNIDIAPRYNPQEGEQFTLDDAGNLQVIQTGESITGVTDANTAYDEPIFDRIGRPIHQLYFGGSLLLAVLGVAVSFFRWRDVSLLWFAQISMTLIYLIFHPSTRYRAPTDPLLFVLSAYALIWVIQRVKVNR